MKTNLESFNEIQSQKLDDHINDLKDKYHKLNIEYNSLKKEMYNTFILNFFKRKSYSKRLKQIKLEMNDINSKIIKLEDINKL